jgi:hypothetical protein
MDVDRSILIQFSRGVRHSRMLLAGIQANSDWTPIKAFGGDAFRFLSFLVCRPAGRHRIFEGDPKTTKRF